MSNIVDLYGAKPKWYENRKSKLTQDFINEYKIKPSLYFSSPGRVEVLGNHTDHNNGKVLVSAIDLDIYAAVNKNNDNIVRLKSEGYNTCIINLDDLEVKESEFNKTSSLIRGVLKGFKNNSLSIGGFDCSLTSNIFKGAGLSSSAAFELLIAEILNYLYNDDKVDRVLMAKIGKYAENVYFNKPSGLLDQMGVSLGGFNYIDFKNEEPKIENFEFNLKDYRVVLINTGGSHGNLTKNYAMIKDDMKKVSSYFNKETLREVNEEDFYKNLYHIKKEYGGRPIIRSIHYFDENKRVDTAYQSLKNDDTSTFIKMINDSGESSHKLLENCFVEKDELQGIALALALSKRIIKDGAVRVHGGGFKGTVIAYVSLKEQLEYIDQMKKVFGERNVYKVQFRKLGVSIVEE